MLMTCLRHKVPRCQVFVRVANIFALKIMWKTVVWFNFNYSTLQQQQQLGGNYVRFAVCCIWGHAAAPYECVITHMRQSLKRPKADVDGVALGSATVRGLRGPSAPHIHTVSVSLFLSLSFYFIWPQQNVHCTKLLVQSELILELVLFLIILISRWKYTELTNKSTLNLIIDFLTVQAREIDSHTVALKMPVSLATLAMLMA